MSKKFLTNLLKCRINKILDILCRQWMIWVLRDVSINEIKLVSYVTDKEARLKVCRWWLSTLPDLRDACSKMRIDLQRFCVSSALYKNMYNFKEWLRPFQLFWSIVNINEEFPDDSWHLSLLVTFGFNNQMFGQVSSG